MEAPIILQNSALPFSSSGGTPSPHPGYFERKQVACTSLGDTGDVRMAIPPHRRPSVSDNQQIPIIQLLAKDRYKVPGTKSQMEPCFPLTVSLTFLMTNLATICHSFDMLVLLRNVGCQRWSLKQAKTFPQLLHIPNTEDQIHGRSYFGNPSSTELLPSS